MLGGGVVVVVVEHREAGVVAEYFPRRFRLSLEEVVADGCEEVGGVVVVVVYVLVV